MRCCALKNKGPGNTKTASMRSPIMAENAESSSSWLRIAIICSCRPSAAAAASDVLSISPVVRSPNVPGSHNPATRESVGTTSLNNCRRLAVSSGARNANPVTFPPGRARLDTSPSATASPRAKATMGIVVVACRAARAAAVLGAMITSTTGQLGRQRRETRGLAVRFAEFDCDVLTLAIAELAEALAEGVDNPLQRTGHEVTDPGHSRRLLRACREWPRNRRRRRRAAEKRDELAPPHSITSSARASTVAGRSRPSALAVLRLMTNSYLEACSTGRSAGLAPLRTLST